MRKKMMNKVTNLHEFLDFKQQDYKLMRDPSEVRKFVLLSINNHDNILKLNLII